MVVFAANRLGVAGILANTEDIDGRAVKTTIRELLLTEFTNISENLHEDSDTLDNDAEKPQNSPNGTTVRLRHGQKLARGPELGQVTYSL